MVFWKTITGIKVIVLVIAQIHKMLFLLIMNGYRKDTTISNTCKSFHGINKLILVSINKIECTES